MKKIFKQSNFINGNIVNKDIVIDIPSDIFGVTIPITNSMQINRLVYLNGGDNEAVIKIHEDGGHAWLQVPKKVIKALGISKLISGYSYVDKDNAYLEEDSDLSIFFQAIGIGYTEGETQEAANLRKHAHETIPNIYNEQSPIRRLNHYR